MISFALTEKGIVVGLAGQKEKELVKGRAVSLTEGGLRDNKATLSSGSSSSSRSSRVVYRNRKKK